MGSLLPSNAEPAQGSSKFPATVEEFRKLLEHMEEPFRTMALTCVCFGLRISECLGLRWSDVDWLNGSLRIQRSIVRQRVGETKTEY